MVRTLTEHEKLIASVCYYKIRKFAKISALAAARCATFGTCYDKKKLKDSLTMNTMFCVLKICLRQKTPISKKKEIRYHSTVKEK